MKKISAHPIALSVAAALSAAALPVQAQLFPAQFTGVQIAGIVDAGLSWTKTGAPGVGGVTGINSGIQSGSRIAFRGSEDLGGGLRAQFVLDWGFNLDTGSAVNYSGNYNAATPTQPNGPASIGFNRRAVVGLVGGVGMLAAGRDYTPLYWAVQPGDAFNYGLYGNLQGLVPSVGGGEKFARISNGLFYRTPRLGGFTGNLAYGFGSESPGGAAGTLPKNANVFMGAGGEYRLAGLTLTGSYQRLRLPNVAANAFTGALTTRKDWTINAAYDFGPFSLHAGHFDMGNPVNVTNSWIGARVNLGPGGRLIAQVQRMELDRPTGTDPRGTVYGLGYVQNLSRRTSVYLTYGQTKNNATGTFALAAAETAVLAGAPGATPKGAGIGITHLF